MTTHDKETAAVLALERELLRPAYRADGDRLRELLHPDFLEFGASGTVWTLDAVVAELTASPSLDVRAVDLRADRVAADAVLVTFRTVGARTALRSSLWVRTTGGPWRLRFHQGTLTDRA